MIMWCKLILFLFSISVTLVLGDDSPCFLKSKYRTFDGSCNNLQHPSYGKAGITQRRFLDDDGPMVAYEDGMSVPRGGFPDYNKPGKLPSPRSISNKIFKEDLGPKNQFDNKRSVQAFAQGQVLAHDLVETKLNSGIDCCNPDDPENSDEDVCFPFFVANANNNRESCKNFLRAIRAAETPDSLHREQINIATAFVDASFLYGSSATRANKVREKNSFLLKNDNGSLPTFPDSFADPCHIKAPVDRCPFAGDPRVSEAPNLFMNHLVWVLEHNRIAEDLHKINPKWDDETVFQETRRIIIAMWQHIVYNEYLPVIIRKKMLDDNELLSKEKGYDDNYDEDVDASIRNGFAAAPMRLGHSQIQEQQNLLADDYKTITNDSLENNFNSPNLLQVNNGANLQTYSRWLTYTSCMKIDNFLVESIRSNLFINSNPPGEDLMSRNIQRGRDQGVPGYNRWRKFCGLKPKKKFRQFGKFAKELSELYDDVDDVDFIVGGFLENGPQGTVGETFSCVLAKQFELLKIGDRFWYERRDQQYPFTKDQLNCIKQGSLLSKVFCRNFNLPRIQKDIFTPGLPQSKLKDCDKLPDIDLTLWKE